MSRHAPFYLDALQANQIDLSVESRIRLEALIRIDAEYYQRGDARMMGYPMPPTVEEMRFDNDRGL